MNNKAKILLGFAAMVTLISIITWQATGGDYYTKFEVVEQIETPLDPNDPLVAAGFYEGTSQTQTVTRKEFRLGLLPTPSSLIDKHAISVVSLAAPLWLLAGGYLWWQARRQRRGRRESVVTVG